VSSILFFSFFKITKYDFFIRPSLKLGIATCLLKWKANPNLVDKDGRSALSHAVTNTPGMMLMMMVMVMTMMVMMMMMMMMIKMMMGI